MGDFNSSVINWEERTYTSKAGNSQSVLKINLSHVFGDLNRKGALLDLLFENREDLVVEVIVGGHLAYSGHEIVEFCTFGVMRKKVSRVAYLEFKSADSRLFRQLASSVHWESYPDGLEVQES